MTYGVRESYVSPEPPTPGSESSGSGWTETKDREVVHTILDLDKGSEDTQSQRSRYFTDTLRQNRICNSHYPLRRTTTSRPSHWTSFGKSGDTRSRVDILLYSYYYYYYG